QERAEATEAFTREAVLLASLHHPSLPNIHDHFTADGRWYMVMDLIPGDTLEAYLHHAGRPGLPVGEVLRIAGQLCAVLDYLHQQQPPVIFRDLKPSNVMVTPTGAIYLIDFGIARFFKPGQAHDTVAFGTQGYAAPEQSGHAQTTAQSDLFSLGVLLHHLLTGRDPSRIPFVFPPIRPTNPRTPPQLEALIMRMVQLNASTRPSSVAVVRRELNRIASQASQAQYALPAVVPSQPPPQPYQMTPRYMVSSASLSTPVTGRQARSCLRVLVISGGTLFLVLCLIAAICSALGDTLSSLPPSSTPPSFTPDTYAIESVQSTLSDDLSTLHDDVTTLAQDTDFAADLAAYEKDW